jgi:N-acetylmuramoyl-L-alanine amidase
MLNKKILYFWLLSCLLILCWYYQSPATDKPKDQLQFSGINRVVIDPGFGGEDFGAPGYINGVYSKDVNLQIAKKLAKEIREKIGLDTIMTRDSDEFIALEKRTTLANSKKGDLFISIQCNSDKDKDVYGIETYCLGVAANAGMPKNESSKGSNLQTILSDMRLDQNQEESCRLANSVQQSLNEYMSERYSYIKDRGVKHAPFFVLMGTEMPPIVIEISFISNPRECKRLISENYQNDLCKAITDGIRHYIDYKNTKKQ